MGQLKKNFVKSQGSAFVGGVSDLLIMLLLKEIYGWHYIDAIIAGGFIGAIFNYSLNRLWAFDARAESITSQLGKYIVVSVSSLILKTSGTYVLTEYFVLDYRISRLVLDAIVAWGFNFLLMHYWVFKPKTCLTSR